MTSDRDRSSGPRQRADARGSSRSGGARGAGKKTGNGRSGSRRGPGDERVDRDIDDRRSASRRPARNGQGQGAGSGGARSGGARPGSRRSPGRGGGQGPRRRSSETDWSERPDWGGVARRGAARVDPGRGRTSGIGPAKSRPEPSESGDEVGHDRTSGSDSERYEPEPRGEWIVESVEVVAQDAVRRGTRGGRQGKAGSQSSASSEQGRSQRVSRPDAATGTPSQRSAGLFEGLGSAERKALLSKRLDEAARAYGRERYGDALKILRPLVRDAPGVAEVRELAGLSYYRLGRYQDATRELKAFVDLTGSTEQHPVLADCARAMKRYRLVEEYWDGLRKASPSADLVVEGRIVMAGALADQGRFDEAVELVEAGRRKVHKPKERHLRLAYVLADLQERAGDLPAARAGFAWLASRAPDFGDVQERLAGLR